jgi:hypothetical protein
VDSTRNAKKFPEACKSQGDAELRDTSQEIQASRDEALQKALQSIFGSVNQDDLLALTIRTHMQADVE